MEAPKRYTIEEIERLPEDETFELLRGEPLTACRTGLIHGDTTLECAGRLRAVVKRDRLGLVVTEVGFFLPTQPETLLAPDVAFVRRDRLPPPSEWAGFQRLAPDLAVEVVSPIDTVGEVNDKTLTYLDAGVQLVWVVDPHRRIVAAYTPDGMARILRGTEVLDGGDVVPGFSTPVADLFAGQDDAG
ncbi:MAG TPA: Uma2 family endonuclease [Thermomicrobiales bacterium]|nr:Uma2 family endonuclease [Thermomicrobiales bacterium]